MSVTLRYTRTARRYNGYAVRVVEQVNEKSPSTTGDVT